MHGKVIDDIECPRPFLGKDIKFDGLVLRVEWTDLSQICEIYRFIIGAIDRECEFYEFKNYRKSQFLRIL